MRINRRSLSTNLAFGVAAIFLPAPAYAEPPAILPPELRADLVRIEKAARRLTLLRDGAPIAVYAIALGFAPSGDKREEGDGRTPEGVYRIDRRNARSAYHLSLGIDYPRPDQRAAAQAEGRDPGGDIFIHGQPNSRRGVIPLPGDWTAGCAAVTNAEIEEIWARVPLGAKVEILP